MEGSVLDGFDVRSSGKVNIVLQLHRELWLYNIVAESFKDTNSNLIHGSINLLLEFENAREFIFCFVQVFCFVLSSTLKNPKKNSVKVLEFYPASSEHLKDCYCSAEVELAVEGVLCLIS